MRPTSKNTMLHGVIYIHSNKSQVAVVIYYSWSINSTYTVLNANCSKHTLETEHLRAQKYFKITLGNIYNENISPTSRENVIFFRKIPTETAKSHVL